MLNHQMVTLNLIIIAASIAGLAAGVLLFNPADLARPINVAVVLIAVACFMDADANNLTRPANFYLSQAMIGFASLLFLGQAMVIGLSRMLLSGPTQLISFSFGFTQ